MSTLFQLLSNAVSLRRDKSILYSRTVINIILYCIYSNFFIKKLVKAIGLFGGLFHATHLTKIFHLFFFIISAIIIQLTAYYPRRVYKSLFSTNNMENVLDEIGDLSDITINKMSEQFKILEYSLIILFIISGAILLMSSSDLISMFLSIELQSFGLYILSTIYKNSELSTRAGLTYFLLGGLSSCFILLGSGLLYTNTATTNLDGIYVITSLSGSSHNGQYNMYESNYINISLIVMTVGFLFKISAAPFHF
jgi:NADH-ubiquinone oxidoreductase chain 2